MRPAEVALRRANPSEKVPTTPPVGNAAPQGAYERETPAARGERPDE